MAKKKRSNLPQVKGVRTPAAVPLTTTLGWVDKDVLLKNYKLEKAKKRSRTGVKLSTYELIHKETKSRRVFKLVAMHDHIMLFEVFLNCAGSLTPHMVFWKLIGYGPPKDFNLENILAMSLAEEAVTSWQQSFIVRIDREKRKRSSKTSSSTTTKSKTKKASSSRAGRKRKRTT